MRETLSVALIAWLTGCGGAAPAVESTAVESATTPPSTHAPSAPHASAASSNVSAPQATQAPCRVVISPTTTSLGAANGLTSDELRVAAMRFATDHHADVGGPSCILAPAPETDYARLVEVMDILIQAGIPNLSLAVRSEEP